MTKEEILLALAIIIRDNLKNPEAAAQLIFDLYADHPSYSVINGKVLNKATGIELGK